MLAWRSGYFGSQQKWPPKRPAQHGNDVPQVLEDEAKEGASRLLSSEWLSRPP